MSDYARQDDFSAKSGQTILGADVDAEFDAIVTAVASKVDESREGSASGIATLDGSALIPVGISGLATSGGGQVPEASATSLGAVELATTAEAITGTDTLRAITPEGLQAVLDQNAGVLNDISGLTSPAADRIGFWDNSASDFTWLTVGDGLEISGTTLQLPAAIAGNGITLTSGVLALDSASAGAGLAYTSGVLSVNVGNGLEVATDTVGLVDVTAGAAQPVVITSGTFTFDLSSITTMAITDVNVAQDGVVMSDNGTIKVMPIDEAGVDVINSDANQTFGLTAANTMQVNTTTARTWTIPANATTAFTIGTVIVLGNNSASDLTITAATGVVLESVYNTGDTAATSDVVNPGGTAVLIKVAADEWMISGDLSDS